MELPSVVFVRDVDFLYLFVYVRRKGFHVRETELCGYRGYGMYHQADLDSVVSFLRGQRIEFRLMVEAGSLNLSTEYYPDPGCF
jgi:hypothetical protein